LITFVRVDDKVSLTAAAPQQHQHAIIGLALAAQRDRFGCALHVFAGDLTDDLAFAQNSFCGGKEQEEKCSGGDLNPSFLR